MKTKEAIQPNGRARQGLREQTIAAIRQRILDGTYAPGEPLSEYQLSESLSVSRTPVREALRVLAAAGLIRMIPGHGAFVAEFTAKDIVEVFQIREQLEVLAVRLAAEQMSDEQLARLRAIHAQAVRHMDKKEPRAAYDQAVKVHEQIIAAAQNERLAQFIDQLGDQIHRLGLVTLASPGRLHEALAEHGEIIDAIATRDPDQAEALLRRHFAADRDVALRQALPAGAAPAYRSA